MKSKEVTKIGKILWKTNNLITKDVRGASGRICTLWNEHKVSLTYQFKMKHWILTKVLHKQSNLTFSIINVYRSSNPSEKSECWGSISNMKNTSLFDPCIIVGDLNLIRTSSKKRGGGGVQKRSLS
jgi:hypothetical protein